MRSVGVVGAGVLGELTARALHERGVRVTLFDRSRLGELDRASSVAAGLLSAFSGRELPEAPILDRARASLPAWRALAAGRVPFGDDGSLVVAPLGDEPLLDELKRGLTRRGVRATPLDRAELRALEPGLAEHVSRALHLPDEGWIDAQAALQLLRETPVERRHGEAAIEGGAVLLDGACHLFDRVVDCRGLHARGELPSLRGVRGELLFLDAPEVTITRPVRVLHPRQPVYLVPRARGRLVLGATLVESDDRGPISARAVLELLGTACAIHPAIADARVLRAAVGVRPAFPDNLPAIHVEVGVVRVNGAYRHGFAVGPALAAEAATRVLSEEAPACASA